MRALQILAGPSARAHLSQHGLAPEHVATVAAAAGGPKGLILGPLDRLIFGEWLPQSRQPIDLVGASIGAWRMATACLPDALSAFARFETAYIEQHYELPPGQKRLSTTQVSEGFARHISMFFGGQEQALLHHPRYRLHVLTSHGQGLLQQTPAWATALGFGSAWLANAVGRSYLQNWLERVVFSSQGAALPFDASDYRTRVHTLTEPNFLPVILASCSIPFLFEGVRDIPGSESGLYWDGGITDYHLHLRWRSGTREAGQGAPIVLYPHFQKQVIPGWLDKAFKSRHVATPALDATLVLAPHPDWVRTLPNGKLPDRNDFRHYGHDWKSRSRVWREATSAARQLADEWADWLARPDLSRVEAL